ncbi:MAG: cytochrome C oxidase subunit IV family protein [Armatimonadetes bacterium]|nr:cytochrome C oxidase subunit IV family protein [Armatimonadota bacterium]
MDRDPIQQEQPSTVADHPSGIDSSPELTVPEQHGGRVVDYGSLVGVWASLLVLMALSVALSGLSTGGLGAGIAVLIALFQTAIALWLFMHLKYESVVYKVFLVTLIVTFTVFIGLTFVDVGFRN